MVAAVETMAYAGEVPWHGLGNKVSNKLSPAMMLKAAQLDWTVSKRETAFKTKSGKWEPRTDEFALVRDSDEFRLSNVGLTYKPVQNEEALDFFKKFVVAGKMEMETAGALWGGRYVWALARLGHDFKLAKGDEVRGYLLLSQPHVFGKAMVIQFTPIRVVCWNTLTYAIGADLKGKAGAFTMPHSTKFDDSVKKRAEEALGLATHQMDEFKQAATLLAKKKATPKSVEEYFCNVLEFDPKTKQVKAKPTDETKVQREPRMLPQFREALEKAPGQDLSTAKGTWWGALNAVTYVVDHEMGRDRSTALRNAWLGHSAKVKRRAVTLALEEAK
jgi:phage/plasmid-like protein (TIGR03299 family)